MKKGKENGELEKLFGSVDENIIGVWKFRQVRKKPLWCATFVFEGNYYDTFGKVSLAKTLEEVKTDLQKLKKGIKEKK